MIRVLLKKKMSENRRNIYGTDMRECVTKQAEIEKYGIVKNNFPVLGWNALSEQNTIWILYTF